MGVGMAFVAKFIFDVPFGKKPEFFALEEKYQSLRTQNGFPKPEILVGSIGAPESRIEIHYKFETLAALEATFAKVGTEPKMADFQREMGPIVVPGSHRWEIFRIHGG